MNYQTIIYEKERGRARIILNRPEKMNALSDQVWFDIDAALDDAEPDPEVRVVIFKGAGRAFCAGHDLSGKVGQVTTPINPSERPSHKKLLWVEHGRIARYERIFRFLKPTIAQVHGFAIYAGMYISMMCDITIAAEDARFQGRGAPVVTTAHYNPIPCWRSKMRAAARIDGKEAERIGLITRAVPADKLEEEVERLADAICLMPRTGLELNKEMLNGAMDICGLEAAWRSCAAMHFMGNFQRFHPDDYSFWRTRRDEGLKGTIESRRAPGVVARI